MPVVQSENPVAAPTSDRTRQKLRVWCRVVLLVLVACELWTERYITWSDGTAYIDVARAWLRGDWAHALNAYWSPLYIWLIAGVFGIFSPSAHWELPLLHAMDFVGFIVALCAWEWLTWEWEQWQGPSSHPILTDIVGYCVILWAGLHLAELGWFNNADIVVLALMIGATAILVRIGRNGSAPEDFVLLGLILGLGFLAKTAFITLIPLFLLAAAILLRKWADRRLLVTALTACALIAPFVAALSISQGRFTMGDSGRVNYSWQVTGMSVEGYKESAYWPGPEARHPIHVLLKDPRVISFEQHLVGTLPVHADPSWWCEGYPVRFNKTRQLMILRSNIVFCIFMFRCPALLLILICLPFAASDMARRFIRAWFLWVPALFLAFTYCFVFEDLRYLAGSYALIGFALIAAAWRVNLPRLLVVASTWFIPVVTLGLLMGGGFRNIPPQMAAEISGRKLPWGYTNVQVAETLHRSGLTPGDRVAYIGLSINAAHVGLERAQVVAMIPEYITHDNGAWGRPVLIRFPKPHDFWARSREDQDRVFEAFRSVGAKWVFADTVPEWADTSGWQPAAKMDDLYHWARPDDRPYVYFRKL
jgi:hypothetical protein